jgi:hypothetical protein
MRKIALTEMTLVIAMAAFPFFIAQVVNGGVKSGH